jgi:murein DD-endopeptidase MepM/ murein hydrolase activator NlpD
MFAVIAFLPQSGGPAGLEGAWHGSLNTGVADLSLRLTVEKSGGRFTGKLNSVEQGAIVPADVIRVDGDSVHLEFKSVKGTYDGKFDATHNTITGTWSQVAPMALVWTRDTKPDAAPLPGKEIAVEIPVPPTAFPAGGKNHLVYELKITNSGATGVELKQIEVLSDGTLAKFSGRDLSRMITPTRIPSGGNRLAYVWVTLEGSALPAKIHHKLTFDNRSFEGAEVTVATSPLPVLGPPLHGEGWLAANGPHNESAHRRALIPIGGTPWIAQRFAIDWVQVDSGGSTNKGDRKDNATYHAYGAEVLAVADAVVATTKDGIPQNVPGENSRAVPMTLETLCGNHIILDLGGGRFAFYAHLQPGSLKVKEGDHVKRGQVLALLGNSGNSSEPHLHFHVSDRNSPLASEGVPYVLESFGLRGKDKKYEPREKQLPLSGDMVKFD